MLPGLEETLAEGAARLPRALRGRALAYLIRTQRPDGGFGGRRGGSDLYYTRFAARLLPLLILDAPALRQSTDVDRSTDADRPTEADAAHLREGLHAYLLEQAGRLADLIDLHAWLDGALAVARLPGDGGALAPPPCAWTILHGARRAWGYAPPSNPKGLPPSMIPRASLEAMVPERPATRAGTAAQVASKLKNEAGNEAGSEAEVGLYATFLGALSEFALQDAFASAPPVGFSPSLAEGETLFASLQRRQRADAGWADRPGSGPSQGNATAAALGLLGLGAGASTVERVAARGLDFLARLQGPDGGVRATMETPVGDGLSTFTALTALVGWAGLARIRRGATGRFLGALRRDDGGFGGTEGDPESDVEYTYYGVASLALLAASLP